MSNVPLPRPGPLGLIQYAGSDMQEYAAAVSAEKDAEIERLRETVKALYEGTMRQAAEIAQLRADAIDRQNNVVAPLRAEVAGLRAELLKSLADNAALRERVRVLEDALRHVDDCLSINDYGDYVLLGRFDSEIVRAALEQKP